MLIALSLVLVCITVPMQIFASQMYYKSEQAYNILDLISTSGAATAGDRAEVIIEKIVTGEKVTQQGVSYEYEGYVGKSLCIRTDDTNSFYKLNIDNSTGNKVMFQLYDKDGIKETMEANNFSASAYTSCEKTIKLKRNTNYYLVVYVSNGSDVISGSVYVDISKVSDDVGDEMAESTFIENNKVTKGKIEGYEDVDWYKVVSSDGKVYANVTLINTTVDPALNMEIYTPQGQLMAKTQIQDTKSSRVTLEVHNKQTYYLKVFASESTAVGEYAIQIDEMIDKEGDSIADAVGIKLGDTVTGSIDDVSDVDVFKINTEKATKLSINITNHSPKSIYYTFQEENGTVIKKGTIVAGVYGDIVADELDKRTNHYLKITGCEGTYTIKAGTVKHKIKYKLNGGKNNSKNPKEYIETVEEKLYEPTRKGFIFKGWYSESTFKNRVKSISCKETTDLTLYAKWEKVTVPKSEGKYRQYSDCVKISWKKVSNAKGYQVQLSTDKKFKGNKTKKYETKKNNIKMKDLKVGKTYYVRLRAYKLDSTKKKVYSSWSKTVTFKREQDKRKSK